MHYVSEPTWPTQYQIFLLIGNIFLFAFRNQRIPTSQTDRR